MSSPPDAIVVVTTTARQAEAQTIAAVLVEKKLAACVQISGPIQSHYRWQGQLETAEEWLCSIKTRRSAYQWVEQEIRSLHPYDEPEILAMSVVAGSAGYLQWLGDQVP